VGAGEIRGGWPRYLVSPLLYSSPLPPRNLSRAFSGELTPRDLVPSRKSPPLRAGRRGGEPRIKGLFRGHWATVLLTLLTFSALARERDRVAGWFRACSLRVLDLA